MGKILKDLKQSNHKKGVKSVGATKETITTQAQVIPNIDNIFNTKGFDLGNLKVYAIISSLDLDAGKIKVALDVNVDPVNYIAEFSYDDLSQLQKDPTLRKQILATIQKKVEEAVKQSINNNKLVKLLEQVDKEVAEKLGIVKATEDFNDEIEVVNFED